VPPPHGIDPRRPGATPDEIDQGDRLWPGGSHRRRTLSPHQRFEQATCGVGVGVAEPGERVGVDEADE
jgi:hypothetical protein